MDQQTRPYAGGSVPENYERHLVPLLFLGYAADLAGRMDLEPGTNVLETACGTGALTRQLQTRLAPDSRLTVTDVAPPMMEQVRRVVGDQPNIEYRQADAIEMPFPDDVFDAVACQFSVMLFLDKSKGMQEAARVLKPGGGFVFNVWDRLDLNGFSRAVHEAVAQVFPDDPPGFLQIPYAYHDLSRIVGELQDAGFDEIDITVQPRESRADDAPQVAMGLVAGSPLANQVAERGSPSLEEATETVARTLIDDFGPGPIKAPMQAFQMVAHLAA